MQLTYFAHQLPAEFEELLLFPISDIHYGNPLFSQRHLDKQLQYIEETPNAFTILNGDLCESTLKTSKGDIYRQVGTPQQQRDWVIKKLLPIKDKILGISTGNHENRIYEETGIDISLDIASALSVPYRPEGILIKVSFGQGNNRTANRPYSYFIYATHGYGGARTKSAKAVKVERLATWIHADCYIMAHDHVVNVAPDVYLIPDNRTHVDQETGFMIGKVSAHRKLLVKSNAYLKWGGYSELKGFPPVDLECPTIKLKGTGEPRIKVEV
jgi:hypothetical protein